MGQHEGGGKVGRGWMSLRGMGTPKNVLRAVGLYRGEPTHVVAHQESQSSQQDGMIANQDTDSYDSEEDADLVSDLDFVRQSMSRDIRRPRTQGSARGSLGSESLAFSAYESESSEVRSHISGESRRGGSASSASSSDSPKSPRTSTRAFVLLCLPFFVPCSFGCRVKQVHETCMHRFRAISEEQGCREDLCGRHLRGSVSRGETCSVR